MHLQRVQLTDFRTYESALVEFGSGVSCLIGANGAGKTNVIEAVAYLSTTSSHRVSSGSPLVRAGRPQASVIGDFVVSGRLERVEITIAPGRANRIRVAGAPARPADLLGSHPTVLFAPEDLAIVKGDPTQRRDFIDRLLVQRSPRFQRVISDLDRVVRQRTALLKALAGSRADARDEGRGTLDVWDQQLVACAAQLLRGRLLLLAELSGPVRDAYSTLAPGSALTVSYVARSLADAWGDEALPTDLESLEGIVLAAIGKHRREEAARCQTLIGPHRDDLHLAIDGLPTRGYASHGESWSAALALRLGSLEVLRNVSERRRSPILLLDDVFAELDAARREHVAAIASDAEQVIVTAAVESDVPAALSGQRYSVSPGKVVPC